MQSAWPLVVDRLVQLLPTLPGWDQVTVYDGPTASRDAPTSFVTVGFVEGEDFGGTWEPVPVLGDLDEETGTVRSELVCQTGDVDYPAMRAQAFTLVDALRAEIDRDATLGVPLVASVALSVDVAPVLNAGGSAVRVAWTLTYTARGI